MMEIVDARYALFPVLVWFWGWGMALALRWLPGKVERWLATKPKDKNKRPVRAKKKEFTAAR